MCCSATCRDVTPAVCAAVARSVHLLLSSFPRRQGLLGAPDVAGIRIAGCLGPATSKLAVIMGWLLSAGAGAHELRAERPSVVELLGVAGMLYSMGSLSQFQAQLRGLTVWYGKTKDASVQPFTDRTTGDDLIRISMEVRPGR